MFTLLAHIYLYTFHGITFQYSSDPFNGVIHYIGHLLCSFVIEMLGDIRLVGICYFAIPLLTVQVMGYLVAARMANLFVLISLVEGCMTILAYPSCIATTSNGWVSEQIVCSPQLGFESKALMAMLGFVIDVALVWLVLWLKSGGKELVLAIIDDLAALGETLDSGEMTTLDDAAGRETMETEENVGPGQTATVHESGTMQELTLHEDIILPEEAMMEDVTVPNEVTLFTVESCSQDLTLQTPAEFGVSEYICPQDKPSVLPLVVDVEEMVFRNAIVVPDQPCLFTRTTCTQDLSEQDSYQLSTAKSSAIQYEATAKDWRSAPEEVAPSDTTLVLDEITLSAKEVNNKGFKEQEEAIASAKLTSSAVDLHNAFANGRKKSSQEMFVPVMLEQYPRYGTVLTDVQDATRSLLKLQLQVEAKKSFEITPKGAVNESATSALSCRNELGEGRQGSLAESINAIQCDGISEADTKPDFKQSPQHIQSPLIIQGASIKSDQAHGAVVENTAKHESTSDIGQRILYEPVEQSWLREAQQEVEQKLALLNDSLSKEREKLRQENIERAKQWELYNRVIEEAAEAGTQGDPSTTCPSTQASDLAVSSQSSTWLRTIQSNSSPEPSTPTVVLDSTPLLPSLQFSTGTPASSPPVMDYTPTKDVSGYNLLDITPPATPTPVARIDPRLLQRVPQTIHKAGGKNIGTAQLDYDDWLFKHGPNGKYRPMGRSSILTAVGTPSYARPTEAWRRKAGGN